MKCMRTTTLFGLWQGAAQIIKGFKSDPDWNGKGYVNMTTISYQDQTDPDLPVITKDVRTSADMN